LGLEKEIARGKEGDHDGYCYFSHGCLFAERFSLKPLLLSTFVLACIVLSLGRCNLGSLQGTGGPSSTTLYAATAAGLSASLNGGSSWTTIGFAGSIVTGVSAISTGTGMTVYSASNSGLFTTSNGGMTWTSLLTGAVSGLYVSGTSIYAATGTGVSVFDGTEWNTTTTTGPTQGIFASGSTVYAGTASSGLFVSPDNGVTWSPYNTSSGLPSNNVLAVFDDGASIYAATDQGLAVTPNTPTTWTVYNSSSGLASNFVQGIYASGGVIYAATNNGLSVYNGTSWSTYLNGVSVNSVYVLGTDIYAATNGGLSVSLNNGTSWTSYTTIQGLASNSIYSVSLQ
jgi:hypothetical protein